MPRRVKDDEDDDSNDIETRHAGVGVMRAPSNNSDDEDVHLVTGEVDDGKFDQDEIDHMSFDEFLLDENEGESGGDDQAPKKEDDKDDLRIGS